MWREVIALENRIKAERIALARKYLANCQNVSSMSDEDLLSIYSCLTIKAKKEKERGN